MSHAELSPSSAHRWIACPGSVALSRGVERTDTAYSREGTFAHGVAAQCLLDGTDAASKIGQTGDGFLVDTEMAEHIQVYLDAVRSTLAIEGGELDVETKVVVSPNIWGTKDAGIRVPHAVHVFDFKYGAGVFVSAADNEQMQTYALGDVLPENLRPDTPVFMHIVQPRCNADRPWRTSQTTVKWLMDVWKPTLENAEKAALAPNAPLHPGEHCGFCPAKHFCPELRKQALTTAQSVFKNLDLVDAPVKPPSPANLTPQQIAVALAGEELVTAWFKGVTEMATALAKKGELPGYKLVAKVGLRKWTNEAEAVEVLKQARINPFAEPKVITPAAAEKLLAKTALGKKGGEALVEKLAHKPITGETLAPVSDPRPAITAGNPFTPIED